jgi:hypothetical protein
MASVTLVESAKLALDDKVAKVIENVITVDHFFQVLPFHGINGNALAQPREDVLGDVENVGVGDTIIAKSPATFHAVTCSLITILSDAEVNGFIQATRSGKGNNQQAIQVASKAKSVGRQFQNQLINGIGVLVQFAGLICLVDLLTKTIYQDTGGVDTDGGPLSFAKLDELIDLVTDKDGNVDYIIMHSRTIRSYYALLRGLGGATIRDTTSLPSGTVVPAYRGIPIFRNDWVPVTQVRGGSGAVCTTVLAGTLDDGSQQHGIAGLTATNAAGIIIEDVGVSESKDERITRVKWYCGLALFSLNGLAALAGVKN